MTVTPGSTVPVGAETTPPTAVSAGDGAGVVAGKGALFIGFAKVYFMLSGFLQQVLLTRLVGLAEFGAFAVVNNVISVFNNTIVQATIQATSKFTAEDDARAGAVQRAGVRLQAAVGSAVGLALFLGAPLIADFEKAPQYTRYFRIAAAIPMLYAVYAVFVGSANGLRRFRVQASFDVGFSTAKTVLLLGLAALWKVTGAFAGFAGAAVVILVIASRVMRLPASGTRFPVARLGGYMGAVIAYGVLNNLALLYDLPLLQHFAGMVDAASAPAVSAHYKAMSTLALLPYQALLVITFVIFPLVSRATFEQDREATRAYVTQTLRYALILVVAMGLVLAARPGTLLAIIYKPEYGEGAPALPILVVGECCLALLAVSCAILNAAGRTTATLVLMVVTVAVGASAIAILVPRTAPGTPMLVAAAAATSLGMASGFAASVVYLRVRLGGSPPVGTILRVGAAAGAAVAVGRVLPAHGKVLGLFAIAVTGAVYLGVLVASGEFGAADRAKFARVLRR
jgi:O-antigen/teichoic acid export membrane protein